MTEKHTEVKAYRVEYVCDKCQQGEMVYAGMTFITDPPSHKHECNHCGATAEFLKRYPTIEYRDE